MRLYEEGYEVEVRSEPAFVIVRHVPFLNAAREVKYGTLVCAYQTERPLPDHTMWFCGGTPHDAKGAKFPHILDEAPKKLAEDLSADHRISSKPKPTEHYVDYYEKVTRYVNLLGGPATTVEKHATARTFIRREVEEDSVFLYPDSATSRANIGEATSRLKLHKVAIIGLGGTGSYILDLVAKTPVREIHLYDADLFHQHNTFRAPGAESLDELEKLPTKVAYWTEKYSKMRRGIIPHDHRLGETNVAELMGLAFVFLAMDSGPSKKAIIDHLVGQKIPFIDVGMGLRDVDGALTGQVRTTLATPQKSDHVPRRISYADPDKADEYASNIQIADLNALNAALAVIKWKKLFGFYHDIDQEHHSIYMINGNHMVNEDSP